MPVKSGSPATPVEDEDGIAIARAAWLTGETCSACISVAVRTRPVSTRPARNPESSSTSPIDARFIGPFFHRTMFDGPSLSAVRWPDMSSLQATRLRKGNLIKVGNELLRVLDVQHMTPGNKRGFVQARLRNIRSNALTDFKLRAEEDVDRAVLDEHEMQYLYADGDAFHFMNTGNFEQIHIDREVLGDSVNYLIPDSLIKVEFYGDETVGIELPSTVDMLVKETAPGIERATASAPV